MIIGGKSFLMYLISNHFEYVPQTFYMHFTGVMLIEIYAVISFENYYKTQFILLKKT